MSNGRDEYDSFESPPEVAQQEIEDEFEFEEEIMAEGEETFEEEDADADLESEDLYFGFDDSILQMKGDIETCLAQLTSEEETAEAVDAEAATEGANNIVGVGLGVAEDDFSPGLAPGVPALNIYVAEAISVEEVKSLLVDSMGVSSASSDDIPVNVIVTGVIEAQNHRRKYRPTPCGVSVGHYRITAGTIGCLARGRRSPRDKRLLMLSNNHVLANSNNARIGDSIIQPGRADGGRSPRDRVAILENYRKINFSGGANYVDAATGWCWPSRVRKEELYEKGGRNFLYRISRRLVRCRKNQVVGKSGRTTGLTRGRIIDCNATIRVNYRPRVALFRDQITIRGIGGKFSDGGDSGSVIWTWDRRRNPVGLLFAGGGGLTFANKMTRVVRTLDINLYT
ncbi:hypothetical protein [Pleurocapsa sp. PCC 7319]|uniref:hypothetical protein n=1 Tax=Pleurocapsa sp. PCC 7319 TaxID=118161 RepID=UPI00034DC378|nr:hypothetical protein [Pleurocapsa sp. PCC 7319]